MKITILFDNEVNSSLRGGGVKNLWGFSAFIQTDSGNILFDTGSNGRILLHNARTLGIDLTAADWLFISHPHWDHIGGWDSVAEVNPHLKVIVPDSLSKHLTADMRKFFSSVQVAGSEPMRFATDFYSTGTMMPEGEQALIMRQPYGLVIVAGCSHPGIENFMARAREIFPSERIYYVIGGFHLLRAERQTIEKSLQHFDTQYITPTHCTGNLATSMIKEWFGLRQISGGVGQTVKLPFD